MDDSPKRGLLAAYGRLLRPLIRILIRNGVSFGEFANVAKHAYVEVAERDFSVPNKEISHTRISALTGLPRREVAETKDEGKFKIVNSQLNEIAAALFGWHTDSDFTGPYGVPLEIRLAEENNVDFKELVSRHVGEVPPRLLLGSLMKIGAVVETERGWFKVLLRHYIPEAAAPDGLDHLARSLEDFATTLDHNRLEKDPSQRLFERQVYTDYGIRPEDLDKFREYATSKAQILLEDIDNWLSQLDSPSGGSEEKVGTGLGIYHYVNPDEPSKKKDLV
jgi:hypothetical protein